MKTAIVTDGNSGITHAVARDLGVYILPTPIIIDGEQFIEGVDFTQEEFYRRLATEAKVSSSQPNLYQAEELWEKLLADYDEIVVIPISKALSETVNTLTHLAESDERFRGKVFVVNNRRVSITQRQAVEDAKKLADEGKGGEEIRAWLTENREFTSIYIMVDTLKYLKKGGRLTPAVAAIGTLLKIKPVLQIQGDKLDQYAKVRKPTAAKEVMIDAVRKDLEGRFKALADEGKMTVCIAHTQNDAEAEIFRQEVTAAFPNVEFTYVDPLTLSVSCHIGPGALALACTVKYRG